MSATKVSILMLCGVAMTVAVGQSMPPVDAQSARPAVLDRRVALDVDAASPAPLGDGRQEINLMLLDDAARMISFQALLTNDQGGPISQPNGQHELDFRLYDSEAGGVPIGEVLDVLVTLDGGVASTQVGPMDPTWFDGTARRMGVTVDNGDELEPLIPLGSVPYAFRVDRVASAELDDDIDLGDGTTAGSLQVFDGDGHVGVDISGSPQWVLVNGQDGDPNAWLRAVSFSLGPVSHGQLSLYDESGNTETVQLTANSNTGGLLSLFDTNAVLRSALSAPRSGGLLVLHDSLGDANLTLHGNGAAIDSLNSDLTLNAGSAQDVILAAGGGNVGIGTTSPDYPLHVETDNSTRAIFALNTMSSGVNYGLFGQSASTSGRGVLGFATAGTGTNYGVYGESSSTLGRGVFGRGFYGVSGQTHSTTGRGVYGYAFDANGTNYGVFGRTNSSQGFAAYFAGVPGSRNYFQHNVGIGTEDPESLLHLAFIGGIDLIIDADTDNSGESQNARLVMRQDGGQVVARVGFREGDNSFEIMQEFGDSLILGTNNSDRLTISSIGNVGIGTTNPGTTRLHVVGLENDGANSAFRITSGSQVLMIDGNEIDTLASSGLYLNNNTDNDVILAMGGGSVGIGTSTPGNFRLAVVGSIRATEIVVETGWSDYVFEPDYELLSLEQVEAHINKHGHLPDIPSAKQVSEHGVKVGEMESKLLLKVEELTLHLIDMNKRLHSLEEENARLLDGSNQQPPSDGRVK